MHDRSDGVYADETEQPRDQENQRECYEHVRASISPVRSARPEVDVPDELQALRRDSENGRPVYCRAPPSDAELRRRESGVMKYSAVDRSNGHSGARGLQSYTGDS